MSEHDFIAADSLSRKVHEAGEDTFQYKLLQAYKTNDVEKQEQYLSEMTRRKLGTGYKPVLFGLAGEVEGAERVANLPYNENARPMMKGNRLIGLAVLDVFRGRYRSAFARLNEANQYRPTLDEEVQIAVLPYVRLSREQMIAIRDEVLKADLPSSDTLDPEVRIGRQLRLYRLALLNCQLGNHDGALEQAAQLEALPAPPYWASAMRALATDVRAIVDANTGKPKEALAKFESIKDDPPLDLMYTIANREIALTWQAEMLYQAGRYDEAEQWLKNSAGFTVGLDVTYPFTLLRRAEIKDRQGKTVEAAALYAQFLKYMSVGDPEVQPLVQDARRRLAAIQRKVD